MKKTYIHILIHILAVAMMALTLAGCDKEAAEPEAGNVAVAFTAAIEGEHARAYDTFWESGDEIGVFCTTATYGIKNVCYVTNDEQGKFTVNSSDEQIYYRNTTMTFFAYYPYKDIGEISTTNRTISFDTSDQEKQKSFDFLYATNGKGEKPNPEVDFTFTHKMSKLTFVLRNGNNMDVSKMVSYTLGDLYLKGSFSICGSVSSTLINTAGTVSTNTAESPSGIVMQLSKVEAGIPLPSLIIIPQTVPPGNTTTPLRPLTFELERNDGLKFTAHLTFENNKIEAGKNYIFTITVNSSGLIVNDCTITDWNDFKWSEGQGQGSAASADDPDEE